MTPAPRRRAPRRIRQGGPRHPAADLSRGTPRRSPLRRGVSPLAFTTGIRPWGLDPGGAWGTTLGDDAVCFWLDPSRTGATLAAARLPDARPTALLRDAADTLRVPRASSGGLASVYAYRSSPTLHAYEVGCRATP